MERVRSFIAIGLPDELKLKLSGLQAQLKTGELPRVKWVGPNGIHLTLKFLGDVSVNRLEDIIAAMEVAARQIAPFHLEVGELGVFPNLRRVQIVWVGMSGETDKLSQLHQRIETNLVPLGFAAESRPFTPHLTLGRVRDQATPVERQRFGHMVASTTFGASFTLEVNSISLMKSQLTREGAIYSRIGLIELIKPLPMD